VGYWTSRSVFPSPSGNITIAVNEFIAPRVVVRNVKHVHVVDVKTRPKIGPDTVKHGRLERHQTLALPEAVHSDRDVEIDIVEVIAVIKPDCGGVSHDRHVVGGEHDATIPSILS